jgi:AcrR family transcriptional regulator
MVDPDPAILQAAEQLFRHKGYQTVLLAEVAQQSGVALPAVMLHYPDKGALLEALLVKYDPRSELKQAFKHFRGGSPHTIVRGIVEQLLTLFDEQGAFAGLAILDIQVNEGRYMAALLQDVMSDAASFITRFATLPGVRPISSVLLGRVLAAYCLGFMATQLLAPESAKNTLRLFPRQVWVENLTQILLYGILEAPPPNENGDLLRSP